MGFDVMTTQITLTGSCVIGAMTNEVSASSPTSVHSGVLLTRTEREGLDDAADAGNASEW